MSWGTTCADLRVLDLSENIAGPLACMILGDMGADVIKVERPGSGDATRTLPPRWGPDSTVFLSVNRNKRSAALDLRTPAGREAVLRLVATSDVVVTSFRPGAADRLGLGFEAQRARNPRVIHCAVNAFGTGPLGHDRPGYDALIQAFVGIMAMTGEQDGGPSRAAPSVVDITTGMWAALAVLAALRRRSASTPAENLELSLVDSGLFLLCHQVMGYLGAGQVPTRLGSAAPSAAPYQVFETSDTPIMIATSTDAMFRTLCLALGVPDLADDPRFVTVDERVARRSELACLLQERLQHRGAVHWLEALLSVGVPVAPVQTLDVALDHPLTAERRLVASADDGRIAGLRQVHLPMDSRREGARRQPPTLGEHTAEVLHEIGMTAEDLWRS